MNTTPLDSLLQLPDRAALEAKMVKLPRHMVDPRIGIAQIPGKGVTVVVMDSLSAPQVYDHERKMWVELQC